MSDELTDVGDKVTTSMGHKMNLGNYENMDFFTSVTVTRRDGESHEDVWSRAWKVVDEELENKVAEAKELLGQRSKSK